MVELIVQILLLLFFINKKGYKSEIKMKNKNKIKSNIGVY